jgi:hypothetical protein
MSTPNLKLDWRRVGNGGFAVAHADIEQPAQTSLMRVGKGALYHAFAASRV